MISRKYNHGRFAIDQYEFTKGGDGDCLFCNFIGDESQGFKVPAKSLMIQNHGGGSGYNYLYYRTLHTDLGTSKQSRLLPDEYVNYQLGEAIFYGVLLWSSNANCRFSLDATPGEWTDKEVDDFISNPMYKKTLTAVQEQLLTTELII
jgi:hypothetical protein